MSFKEILALTIALVLVIDFAVIYTSQNINVVKSFAVLIIILLFTVTSLAKEINKLE